MPGLDTLAPFLICAVAGGVLAILELLKAFNKWIGRFWWNRYVLALIALNALSAGGVFAFLRYGLEMKSGFWLAVITGLTFPTILRTKFTFYQPVGAEKDDLDTGSLALRLDSAYQNLQGICFQEVNSQIADARAQVLIRLHRCLSEQRMIDSLSAHIASELLPESRQDHSVKLEKIKALSEARQRSRELAALMLEIMPDKRIRSLLRDCR